MYRGIRKIHRYFSSTACRQNAEKRKLPNLSYTIRSIKLEDFNEIAELSRENNFQIPLPSLRFWAAYDPDGIQVAVNESGRILGLCSGVKNSENLYFGGMFIVQEKYRNTSVGRKVLKKATDHAGEGNLGLNCIIDMIQVFQRKEFKNFESDWKSLAFISDGPVNTDSLSDQLPAGVEILPYHPTYLEAVMDYDRSLVGYERRSIIETSCNERDGCYTLVATKDGRCVGFGSIKLTVGELGLIGPLYADDVSIAEAMVKRLIPILPEAKGFAIATISNNIPGNMIVEKLQIPICGNFYRMYTKEKLKVDTSKIFAHFDIEFSFF